MQDLSALTFFEQSALIMFGVALTAISGATMAYFRSRSQCFRAWQDMVAKLDKRTFRIEKALILKAKMTDDDLAKLHPEERTRYEAIIKEMLEDEQGNL